MWRIGVDVGGTKIEAILISPSADERERLRVPSPRGNYRATLAAISYLVNTLTARHGITRGYSVGTASQAACPPKPASSGTPIPPG